MGKWRKKMEKARRLHRPSLEDWECDGLHEQFPSYLDSLSAPEEQYRYFLLPTTNNANTRDDHHDAPPRKNHNVPIVLDARTLTREEFWKEYEAKETPCVIKNIPCGFDGAEKIDEWNALHKWSVQALQNDSILRDRTFKCGEDDDGNSVRVKLKYFLRYMEANRDDSPLYIFDSRFEDDRYAKSILSDYQVPSYFRDDLFRLVSESRRPPYRWFLVGPQRSGTTVHIDPLATNAWNTLLVGKKRWVLFPPHVPKHVVKGKGLIRSDEDDEAIHYFMNILPRIKRKAAAAYHHDDEDYRDFACYEFTQNATETVFVPNGWWHAVLNLTDTVGVTQNFCSPRNFDKVWIKTRTGRKRMAWKWLCQLDQHYPELADRARWMNKRDNFHMKYDPAEMAAAEAKRKQDQEHRRKLQRTV